MPVSSQLMRNSISSKCSPSYILGSSFFERTFNMEKAITITSLFFFNNALSKPIYLTAFSH